ncbi:DUF4194 domain-containing protein [Arcobacter peruensis]|uniref:DUF4194 domain-containing protein n=1 Tax=Arcobacter peruensis TaxID=2320140 RepID=UPI000F090082|nr:DUF4194 domain-containing protein [Arcobacter peruensis]
MRISQYIKNQIEDSGITEKEFGDIVIYLMHNGVICRPDTGTHSEGDPTTEKKLYDDFLLVKNEINDFLSILGIDVYHNEEFRSIRLFPPDADYPGSNIIRDEESASSLMRLNITKDLAASLIVLYLLYEQHSSEKEEDFTVVINEVEFMSSFKSKLNLDVAEKISKTAKAKEELFKELKRLRVIKYHKNFFNHNEEYPIIIRPLIFDLVPQGIVKDTLEEFRSKKEEKEGQENGI